MAESKRKAPKDPRPSKADAPVDPRPPEADARLDPRPAEDHVPTPAINSDQG